MKKGLICLFCSLFMLGGTQAEQSVTDNIADNIHEYGKKDGNGFECYAGLAAGLWHVSDNMYLEHSWLTIPVGGVDNDFHNGASLSKMSKGAAGGSVFFGAGYDAGSFFVDAEVWINFAKNLSKDFKETLYLMAPGVARCDFSGKATHKGFEPVLRFIIGTDFCGFKPYLIFGLKQTKVDYEILIEPSKDLRKHGCKFVQPVVGGGVKFKLHNDFYVGAELECALNSNKSFEIEAKAGNDINRSYLKAKTNEYIVRVTASYNIKL